MPTLTKQTTLFERFMQAYMVAAIWSSNGGDDTPLDATYNINDFSPGTIKQIAADCANFWAKHSEAIIALPDPVGTSQIYLTDADITTPMINADYAGHHFWLTRNGHGMGYWDGTWPEKLGDELTEAAKAFGNYDLTEGDDGRLYGG